MSDINITVNDEIVNIDVIDEPVLVNVVNSPGVPGAPGVGVPVGGTTGQVLAKNSATNYDTEWVDVSGGAWGTITGTLSNQTDLQTALDGKFDDPTGTTSQYLRGDGSLATFPSLTGYVPYTGATGDVDLGTHRILAQNATIASSGSGDTFTLNHSSGSGIGLNITKGGNGEGLYINKTGGSGNAATIIGTINATTLVKSGGTSSQFLKADGTVDSSVYVPTSRELTINGVTYDLSANRSWTVAGGISGSGASGQVAYWTGTSAQSGSNNLFWDNTNVRLGVGTNAPISSLDVVGSASTMISRIRTTSTGPSNNVALLLQDGTTGTNSNDGLYLGRASAINYLWTYETEPLVFGTSNTERIRVFAGGNVAIGSTTDNGQRLQVQGTTLLNGNVTFSSSTGMFWDAANSRLGIGTNAPSDALTVRASGTSQIFVSFKNSLGNNIVAIRNNSNNTVNFSLNDSAGSANTLITTSGNSYFNSGGNYLFGSTTDSGERLQVTGDTLLKGSGATGATFGLKVQNSSGVNILRTRNDGPVFIEAVNTVARLYMSSNGDSLFSKSTSGTNGIVCYGPASANHTLTISSFSSDNYQNGALSSLRFSGNFVSASGSTAFSYMLLNGTINQTGTSTSIVRGLYVNPTLTAAADFRAIETARGNVVFGNLPTSPVGLPTGAIWNNLGMINIV
jgi:hypothetical protein